MEIHGPLTGKKFHSLHLQWRENPRLSSMTAWRELEDTRPPSGSLPVIFTFTAGQHRIPWTVPRTAARLNLAAGSLPSFYLLPNRAHENNSKNSMSFRPWLSLKTGHGMPIKLHPQASRRFQSHTLNRDKHTKPAANYTKGPDSAQRLWGSMNGSGYATGSPTQQP